MADLIVSGGRVLRPDWSIERADIRIDQQTGTIEAVGDVAGGGDELDAQDGLVIPGLVNAHTHAAMTLFRGLADDKPLERWLREDIWPVEAALTPADIAAGTRLAAAEMIRSGTTAFGDMYFAMPRVADVVAETGLRARLGHGCITVGKDDEAARADFQEGLAFARAYDGAADGRIRTMLTPHSLTTVGEQYFEDVVPRARAAKIPIHFHANETPDEVDPIVAERNCRPLEWAADLDLLGPSSFVAHAVHVDDREISLLAETGTSVVHCPASNMKLASGMAPIAEMRRAGVSIGLGTDGAASNNDLSMFDEMRDAAMLGKLAAGDASAVPAAVAFEMATAGSSAALGLQTGRLAPGAPADLAVVDLTTPHLTPHHDLLSHLVYAASGSDVRHTVCDGSILMRDRELTTLDVDAVRETASERASRLVARSES